ncbi:hypothetical protein KIN20_035506 [Parelaphostrongylus tenuis]|uniref:PI3K/PI4K catalytic domain-containing protein n=1 Tax=Parelaphostrongylus tenuis TaxID=148309 RepID=A0AAD5RBB1_PARTN|nr:hypothetical protein KIN20_035506 [Parelaphostrongylus tenuis]
MSMIGAILGLGDRHLDNVLVNLDRGDVVHIDYNICFDKGKHLRVPETVPFRLTQNILHALGPTQVEGVFRESCSKVLSTLREGREVLLTVLDAFVYDPLVDWAVSDHLTASSAAVGVAVTLAVYGTNSRAVEAKPVVREMFSVRVRENDLLWTKNFNELQSALASVVDVLRREHGTQKTNAWKNRRTFREALATCDGRFVDYIHAYRVRFSEPLVKAHQLLDAESLDLDACLRQFAVVQDNISDIYSGLISLNKDEPSIRQHSSGSISPNSIKNEPTEFPPGFEDTRPHHKQQQEQNVHANNVVRRVRARLEGRIDSSEPQKLSAQMSKWTFLLIKLRMPTCSL